MLDFTDIENRAPLKDVLALLFTIVDHTVIFRNGSALLRFIQIVANLNVNRQVLGNGNSFIGLAA
jgi:hypothetical protein